MDSETTPTVILGISSHSPPICTLPNLHSTQINLKSGLSIARRGSSAPLTLSHSPFRATLPSRALTQLPTFPKSSHGTSHRPSTSPRATCGLQPWQLSTPPKAFPGAATPRARPILFPINLGLSGLYSTARLRHTRPPVQQHSLLSHPVPRSPHPTPSLCGRTPVLLPLSPRGTLPRPRQLRAASFLSPVPPPLPRVALTHRVSPPAWPLPGRNNAGL